MVREHGKIISQLNKHYSKLAKLHGNTPQAVQFSDHESHWRRFSILAEVGIRSDAKIIDFGCGTGEFLNFLKSELDYKGEYIGIDISEEQIAIAKKEHPSATFFCRDIFSECLSEEADFIIINGVFNNKVANADSFGYMSDILKALMPLATTGIAFNAMSTYVDYFDESLVYFDPSEVFKFCKEQLSNCVILRHDYIVKSNSPPFEFCIYVYKDEFECRRNQIL